MNNIFKVIWNHATQTWTAVGELASAKGKSKSVKLAAISTALLVVTGGAQTAFASSTDIAKTTSVDAGSSAANTATIQYDASMQGGLAISPDRVTDQFKGDAHNGTANIPGATVYAYDGIAIGSGTVAGTKEVGGNGHVAIGLMARANGAKTSGAAVALGAYAVAEEQDAVAIGNKAYANGSQAVSIGHESKSSNKGTVAVGNQSESTGFNSTAVGDGSNAVSNFSTALGGKSKAKGWDTIAVGYNATVDGDRSTGVGARSELTGTDIASLGKESKISSNKVSTLGAGITVGEKRDGAVVLGYGSDADNTTVTQEDQAKVGDLTYSGFKGNLKNITNDLAGRFVSVGSKDNERQIKHVAAGKIDSTSTDAINGSQLYSVANTLGTAAKGLADTLGVTLNPNGTVAPFSQPLTTADGSDYNKGKPAITAPNVTTALTNLNNYVNEGWKVTASGNGYDEKVSVGHTVNFVGSGNVDVDGSTINGVRTVNISVDSPIDYASTTATVDGKTVNVAKANDGKWYPVDENGDIKEGAKPVKSSEIDKKGAKLTDSDTENNPYEKGNSYTYDDKGNITATGYDKTKPESKDNITAGKNGVQLNNVGWATKPDQAVNKDQLDQTVNKSGFYVQQNGKSTLDGKAGSDEVSDTEKVTPNDVVNFVNGNGTVIKAVTTRDANGVDTTKVSVDVDMAEIAPESDGSVKGPVPQDLLDALDAAQAKVDQNPDDEEAKKALEAAEDAVNKAGGNKAANAQNVADMINSSGFTLKTSATADGKKESGDDEIINPGKTVEMVAGKNLTVKQEANGKVTYSMKDDVEFTSVKVGEDKDGKKPVNFTTEKATDASNNDPANKPTTALNVSSSDGKPTQITGVGSTLNVKPVDTNPNGTPTADADKPNLVDLVGTDAAPVNKNAAATVGDLQNMGWVVSTNDGKDYKDVVKNANEVRFVGKNAAKVSGKTDPTTGIRTITVDVEAPSVETAKITQNTDGSVTGPVAADEAKKLADDLKKAEQAVKDLPADATPEAKKAAQDALKAAQDAAAPLNKVATAQNVADMINASGFTLKTSNVEGGEKDATSTGNEVINPGKAVEMVAGKNLTVKQEANGKVTYSTKDDVSFNSVQFGGVTGPKITNNAGNINVSGPDGKTPTKITGVAPGEISATSKDAINGSQLHATNEKVASLGTTVNNLDRKVNKHSKQARAGIAGANAAAALPQAYTQGKAMVAAAAGTFKGQNALAVGYSRISDNGKVILKLQGNANTSGDVGAGVGVGYQW